jgi:hypothetical protein
MSIEMKEVEGSVPFKWDIDPSNVDIVNFYYMCEGRREEEWDGPDMALKSCA